MVAFQFEEYILYFALPVHVRSLSLPWIKHDKKEDNETF